MPTVAANVWVATSYPAADMKKSLKITLCAICSALSVSVIMLGYFPYFTYAAPAVAGLFVMLPTIEISKPYALATYITSSVLVLIFAEPETKILFVLLFGYYPIVKSLIEKIKSNALIWILKILLFTASMAAIYLVMRYLTNIDVEDFGYLGIYVAAIFAVVCYVAFVLYDIAISRLAMFYLYRVRPNLKGVKK